MRTALSAIELTVLRCPKQWQRLYVAVHKPATLFTARLASVPASWSTGALAFNTGSPTSGTAPRDSTIWIGSTPGGKEKGVIRLRANLTLAATGSMSIAELGQQSFNLAENDYLTIIEDIRPAARHIRYSNGVWYIDFDTAYLTTGSGNNYLANDEFGPLARIGPPAIGFLESGSIILNYDGTRSAAYTAGKTISAYAWTFPNTDTSVSPATTITYSSAIPGGRFHKLTVTESDTSKTHIRYGLTYVFDRTGSNAPYDAALLTGFSGGPRQGGYRGTVVIKNTTAALTDFPDEAHVTVFSEDHWLDEHGEYFELRGTSGTFLADEVITGGTSGATGTIYALPAAGYIQIDTTSGEWQPGEIVTGEDSEATARLWCIGVGGNFGQYRQNIVLDGYIVGESIAQDPETGQIEFEIATLDEMMRHAEGYPVALTNRSTTPTLSWEDSKVTTLNTATHHFIKWRSTIGAIADVEFAGTPVNDNVIIKYITFDKGTLWDQLNNFWNNTIFGWVASDRQGTLYCEMDCVIDEDYRGNTIVGHTLTRASDLMGVWELPRQPIDEISQYLLLGVAYRKPLGSKSPGDPLLYEGISQEVTTGIAAPLTGGNVATPDQDTFNEWSGNLRARGNNSYKNMLYRFAGNWRLDVVPQHFITHSIASGDTPRSLTLTSQHFIPRELRLNYNAEASALLAEQICDAETSGIAGVTYILPTPQNPEVIVEPPPDIPIPEPSLPNDADEIWVMGTANAGTYKRVMWSGDFFAGGQPSWNSITLPSGYQLPPFAQAYGHSMQVALDGSALYLCGRNTDNSSKDTIWKLTNIAAIRAAPATSPTWSIIAQEDDVVSIGPLDRNESGTTWRIKTVGATLYVPLKQTGSGNAYYSTYDGAAWTYTSTGSPSAVVVHKNVYGVIPPNGDTWLNIVGGAMIGNSWTTRFGEPSAGEIWCRYNSTSNYYVVHRLDASTDVLIRNVNSSVTYDTDETAQIVTFTLGGAWGGADVFAHSQSGKIWTATSGVAFTLFDTVSTGTGGRLMDAKLLGGGGIVRAQNITLTGNAPLFINKNRVAGDWTTMTGDWYSVWSDGQTFTLSSLMLTFL